MALRTWHWGRCGGQPQQKEVSIGQQGVPGPLATGVNLPEQEELLPGITDLSEERMSKGKEGISYFVVDKHGVHWSHLARTGVHLGQGRSYVGEYSHRK